MPDEEKQPGRSPHSRKPPPIGSVASRYATLGGGGDRLADREGDATTPTQGPSFSHPSAALSHERADAPAHFEENAQSHQSERVPARTKRGYALRDDLIKDLKRVALEEDRKLYEVMEEAMAEYLARKRIRAKS